MGEKTRWVVFDIEGDSLTPTKIYCLSYKDHEGQSGTITSYNEIETFFSRYGMYVGHNIRRWDLPALQRLVGIRPPAGNYSVVDTLALAWYLDYTRGVHNLESYGESLGVPKPKVSDWHSLDLAVYIARCEADVEINFRLWCSFLERLKVMYPEKEDLLSFLKYIDFKLYSAALQEESGWKFDREFCEKSLQELSRERDEKFEILKGRMPRVPIVREVSPPKRPYKSDGELSVLGLRWKERLVERGLPEGYDGVIEEVVGYDDPNPGSSEQVKSWLFSLGWKPTTFKQSKSKKTGETKDVPQVNRDRQKGGGLCESVLLLGDKEPAIEILDGLSILNHRISVLSGFLRDSNEFNYLFARISGLTNTLRFKHTELVNLPKPENRYAAPIRACLIAPGGYELCGADKTSLEDKIKQHFLFPHDPDYVRSLQSEDYDPHLDLALLAGKVTEEEVLSYKREEKEVVKRVKPIRSIYKNGNYACQYGAGPPRLSITCGVSLDEAREIHKTYWKRNWAIKAVAEEQDVRDIGGELWLVNPINGFLYSLRSEKDIFSTLVQGTASFVFDLWLRKVLERREQVTAQFHDELVLTILKGHREEARELLQESISEVNQILNLNVELSIGIQFGDNYAQIH